MAQMIERQLTHRAAARSVSGLASVLAHEIKNPLSGIRGAAQLLEPGLDGRRPRADAAHLHGDRPHPQSGRPHGGVRRRAPAARRSRSTSTTCSITCAGCAESGLRRGIRFTEDYDPSLPPVPGNRDKLVQAFLNLVKNAAEAIEDDTRAGPHRHAAPSFRPGVRLSVPGTRHAHQPAADDPDRGQRAGRPRSPQAAPVRSLRHDEAHGHRARPRAGRQDHRRPRRHHRVRIERRKRTVFRVLLAPAGARSRTAKQR